MATNEKLVEISISQKVFNKAYIADLENTARVQIYFGGSSSGKSVFLAQRTVLDVLKGGRNFLVCRQVGRTVRASVVQEITKIIKAWKLSELFAINKTDGTITCQNGFQIVFTGLDDVEKIKSITPAKGVFTDIRIEEATETDLQTVKQLEKRLRGKTDPGITKRLVLSFNPILQTHWIYEEYFAAIGWANDQTEYSSPDLFIRKTTYKDNSFLELDDIKGLENEKDPYYYNVYSLGNWGILGHVIFTNWAVEDLSDRQKDFTSRRHGLDFGFSSDPAAVVCTHYDRMRKTIYIYNEFKAVGLTNDLLAIEVKRLVGTDPIVCDSAEPKSIAELRTYRVLAMPARKGKDSVLFGIQWLQQNAVVVDKKCVNMIKEFQQSHWKEDNSGRPLPIPSEVNNHLLDALRYAYEDAMKPVQKKAGSHSGY